LSAFTAWKHVREAVTRRSAGRLNLREVRLHDLRHTFAAGLTKAGAALPRIQVELGHRNAQMSQKYANYRPPFDGGALMRRAEQVAKGADPHLVSVLADPLRTRALLRHHLSEDEIVALLRAASPGPQAFGEATP
jgi:integrase